MATQLTLAPKHQQKIIPKAIQGLQVLALPITELDEYLDHMVLENPLLEIDYQAGCDDYLENDPLKQEMDYSDYSSSRRKSDIMDALSAGERFRGNVPESETLHGFLRLQLLLSHLSDIERVIGEEIIGNINDDGYFVGELCEITYRYGQDVSVGMEVLKIIQTFSPLGVGAGSVEECLLLQLDPQIPYCDKIRNVIQHDLEELAQRKITKLTKKYGLSKAQIQEILDYIRTLNPRPGNEFESSAATCYIIPDIAIKKQGDEFTVYINDEIQPTVNLNSEYVSFLRNKGIDDSEKEYIRRKCNEAKILIKSLDMRNETLKQLAFFLLQSQHHFFENGPASLHPLMMQEAADAMGLHVSTISRAVQGKYMQTPWGMFPLKYFFNAPIAKKSMGNISAPQIQVLMKNIIEEENPLQPLSDIEIMEKLHGKGISISRRTIAKYRQIMGIDGQNGRRRFG